VGRVSFRERWIQAMSKVPYSLIGYKGYTEEDAHLVCQYFQKDAPLHPRLEIILALEAETRDLPPVPQTSQTPSSKRPFAKDDFITVLKAVTKPIKNKPVETKKVVQPTSDDYPRPWCKVLKDGEIIRYEDSNGKPIPEIFWRVV